ncbi:prophage tail fiber N-terminal domain-containing protein [Xanthomonas phage XaC1]|nr:prophage tail fiber N-terminal domain-containing protein [Xanthomonas phage XaC1]
MSYSGNAKINGTIDLDGMTFDISVSPDAGNALVKKDNGYYVQPSTAGKSAYDIAKEKGYTGTEADFAALITSANSVAAEAKKLAESANTIANQALTAAQSKVSSAATTVVTSGNVFQVDVLSNLRKTEPSVTLTKASVKSCSTASTFGGGDFFYDSTDKSSADDGGMVIVTAKGARWKRIVSDPNLVNVTHFGAIPDGKTDCSAAVMAMFKWSQKYYPRIGIQFPAGTFKINSVDFSASQVANFRMVGAMVSYGYFPATYLVSDRGSDVMVKVKARWTEISNFYVNGEIDKQANTKGFFQNTCIEGQFVRVQNMLFQRLGGYALQLVDTLDTKIDQFYAGNCTGGIVKATWSGSATGSWDHSTAIELSNFNIQSCTGPTPVFDIQRCTQSILRNGWIEKTTTPGDLSNGQWVIEALSMEDCTTPLNLTYCRYILSQKNLQGASSITTTDSTKTRWLSIWEDGNTEIENFGIKTTGAMNYGFLTSENRFRNSQANAGWVKVGDLFVPNDGDTVNIRIIGTLGFSSVGVEHKVGGAGFGGGESIIRAQKKNSGVQLTWESSGATAVQDVMYVASNNKTDCAVYVKLGPWVMNCISIVESTSKDRYNAGVCFRWTPAGTNIADADFNKISGLVQAPAQLCIAAGKNGIVVGSDGYIGLSTVDVVNNQLPIYINGQLYKITLSK